MGFLASAEKRRHVGWCPGPEVQASSLWGVALDPLPPTDILSRPSRSLPAPPLITDLHSESSLLFLLRAGQKEGETDNWMGLVGVPDICRGLT